MANETKTGSQDVKTSDTKTGTTSEQPQTFTKEQTEAMVSKARSDALAEMGRYKKAMDDAVKQAQAVEERLSRAEDERFERDLEDAKDDPVKLREIRQRQKENREKRSVDSDRRRWESEKATLEERVKKAELVERRELAREVASEYKVDYKILERFATDRDSMVDLAKTLPKSGEEVTRVTEPPEGGKTAGTTGKLTLGDVEKMSPEERAKRYKEIAEIPLA